MYKQRSTAFLNLMLFLEAVHDAGIRPTDLAGRSTDSDMRCISDLQTCKETPTESPFHSLPALLEDLQWRCFSAIRFIVVHREPFSSAASHLEFRTLLVDGTCSSIRAKSMPLGVRI